MTPKELNFAYKVRNALNENLDNLPAPTAEKLASARKMALSRKKNDSPLRALFTRRALATESGGFFTESMSWLPRMGLLILLVVLATGLVSIYQYEQEQRISDTAEIDAGVLSDELPLSAYVDHGFNAFLATRGD
ncbi:DUF3619 family protein [Noviherbaspirillum cavernae]|uniref:DUF3619 family protein n=1 Tax=Noviherbaspirillum cavernae TaxID=2320862 RepID=A0A418X1S3_9BURK|nr:DUF3619 family protein [Noviherbaspirillum cavernae]RJG06388.1 DUF3619 family protein [Noviherbaspirillum cavernae]